jgi:lipoprotein-releasing system ATP-binding protein
MNENLVVELKDLRKTFKLGEKTVEVLKGINLKLKRGEVLAITGASGVGKTTLLHIIGGIEKPTSGRIIIDGIDITDFDEESLSEIRGKKTAFIFQFYHLLPDFTVLENVMLPGLIKKLPFKTCKEKALFLLQEVGLSERVDHFPSELSGGEQQRVAIARALLLEPLIILADEPTGNLDPKTAEMVFELLIEKAQKNQATLIVATHNLQLAKKVRNRVEMVDGRFSFPDEEE